MSLRRVSIGRSNVFNTTEVRATGLWSFRPLILGFLGTGMMVDVFKKPGTVHSASEVLKMSVNTGDSWSAQNHSVEGETAYGPAALRGFIFFRGLLTSLS